MAKYFGVIGYAKTMEIHPGVYEEVITEKQYYGDILRNTRRVESNTKINSEITISNQISIVADPFAMNNIYAMRYITFAGAKWKISSVDIQYPRMIISMEGLYNDENTRIAPAEI